MWFLSSSLGSKFWLLVQCVLDWSYDASEFQLRHPNDLNGKTWGRPYRTILNLKEKPQFYPKHVQLALQFK